MTLITDPPGLGSPERSAVQAIGHPAARGGPAVRWTIPPRLPVQGS
jgi:hypothetical protein